jgi:small conductance mechanosensitive channel
MANTPLIPLAVPPPAHISDAVRDALPNLTVMLVHGALDFVIASVILIVGWSVASWLARSLRGMLDNHTRIDETLRPLLVNGVRYGVLLVTITAVLDQFGIQTTSVVAVVGAAGLATGLALQGSLSNVASGVLLLFLRPYRVGDHIVLTGITGQVREVGLFRTEMTTDDGLYVSIPNTTVFSGVIINASRQYARRTDFSVDIDRAADIAGAQAAILHALARDKRVAPNPPARVVVDGLNGPQVLLTVQAWVSSQNFTQTQSELRVLTRQALNAKGISPPVPIPAPAVAPWAPPSNDQPSQASVRN